ncbi:MAG TPA: FAD/NAD(P)-binding oxidoreductase [Armatimonadota bacterium]|jgi:NADPH-dependent 2,4-dienoyl-CoA reductase/sulfur reductase-like enzyme
MTAMNYRYILVGGGLAGASAVDGIREVDKDGSILLLAAEAALPYNRPPLSKGLWLGKEQVSDIFVHDEAFYQGQGVDMALGTAVSGIDPAGSAVHLADGRTFSYGKLLLATGGAPRKLSIPGGDLPGLSHYRTLGDYGSMRAQAGAGKSAVVIGGGFIGSEMAAALNENAVDVTMVFPEANLVQRVFPEGLGRAIQGHFRASGVRVLAGDAPASIEKSGEGFVTHTRNGENLPSDIVVVGIGIAPGVELAQAAGLKVENGIVVDDRLRTTDPGVYAAGDNASFPYTALGIRTRVEHWDNALNQGKQAGRNMAGADEPYDYMPFFFSDLFEFGYEAVGEVDSRLETFADWQDENVTGVIYYLRDGKVRGAMMCNVWEKVDAARNLIRAGETVAPGNLRGAIH